MTRPHEHDDLWYALEYNTAELFKADDVADIVAEVPGENDELEWWWVLLLADGRHALFAAGCDYTGWDCQSGISVEQLFDTALECAEAAPQSETYSGRRVRENLLQQLSGDQPKFTYTEDYGATEGE